MVVQAFGQFPHMLLQGKIDLNDIDGENLKILLYTDGLVINQDDDVVLSDVADLATYEVNSGTTNYERKTLSYVLEYDETTNKTRLKLDEVVWTASDFTCRGAIIYSETNNILITAIDFEEDKSGGDLDFVIAFSNLGLLTFTVPEVV
jgi:hypothetical protein